jgi:hypothetical protein
MKSWKCGFEANPCFQLFSISYLIFSSLNWHFPYIMQRVKFKQDCILNKELAMQSHGIFHSNILNIIITKKAIRCFLFIFLIITATAYAGKEFWESKPFDEWTPKECQRLLVDSPWAKVLNLTGRQSIGYGGGGDATDSQPPFVKYIIQLRSAQPIRQAMVRQMQLAQNYDKLPDEQKKEFSAKAQPLLQGNSQDFVVVNISFSTNNREYLRDLLRHWQSRTVELLKNSVYLSGSKGSKVPISMFTSGKGGQPEFQFVFPRQVNGKDVLSPEDKALRLEFDYLVVGEIGDGKGFIEFKTDKMKVNNEVVY